MPGTDRDTDCNAICNCNYLWSTGATSQSISVNNSSVYSVTVTNSSGCTNTASGKLTINALPTVNVTSINICPGTTGTLTVVTPNAIGYSYLWNAGQTTMSIQTATSGQYCVTVTNINACKASACGTVSLLSAPSVNVPNVTICSGNIRNNDSQCH